MCKTSYRATLGFLFALPFVAESSGIAYTVTIQGSAMESWWDTETITQEWDSLNGAGTKTKESLIILPSQISYTIDLEGWGTQTTAEVKLDVIASDGKRSTVDSASCSNDEYTSKCIASISLSLDWTQHYDATLTIKSPSTSAYGKWDLKYSRDVEKHGTVYGGPYTINDIIGLDESPKTLGSFYIEFNPLHGGAISDIQYTIRASDPAVNAYFSDTRSDVTRSDAAEVIVSISATPTPFRVIPAWGSNRQSPHLIEAALLGEQLVLRTHIATESGGFILSKWLETGSMYRESGQFADVLVGDVNGDGFDDLVHVRTDGGKFIYQVYLSDGVGGLSPVPRAMTGIMFGESGRLATVLMGDVNGDGRMDLVHARTDNRYLIWKVYLAASDGKFAPQTWYQTGDLFAEDGARVGVCLANLDRNTRSDIVHWRTDAGKLILRTHLATATGGFVAPMGWYQSGDLYAEDPSRYRVLVSDLNGDGLQDVVHVRSDSGKVIWKTHFANGSGGFSTQPWFRTQDYYAESGVIAGFSSVRLNKDAKGDLVHWRTDSGKLIARNHLGNSIGSFTTLSWYATGDYYAEVPNRYEVVLFDMTGDGFADLIHWRTDGGKLILKLHRSDGTGGYNANPWYRP